MGKWIIDPDHTVAAFSVRHMMIANVRGQFNKIMGFIEMDQDNRTIVSMEARIQAESIWTGIRKRDDHLRSPDFFDTVKYPEITFKSSEVKGNTENGFHVTGDLTMHGITRTINSAVQCAGPVKSPFGGEITLGFSANFHINREDFGIMWNEPLENGGVLVAREVSIFIDAEADLSDRQG